MKHLKLFFLKNTTITTILVVGMSAAYALEKISIILFPRIFSSSIMESDLQYGLLMDAIALFLVALVILIYELPIRHCLNQDNRGKKIDDVIFYKSQQRILNEPFIILRCYIAIFIPGSILFTTIMYYEGVDWLTIQLLLADGISAYLIAILLIIVIHSKIQQKYLIPHFFPRGGLFQIDGLRRMSIRFRFIMILLGINILPIGFILRMNYKIIISGSDPMIQFSYLSKTLWIICPIIIAIGIIMVLTMSSNVTRAMNNLVDALHKIAKGNYDTRVELRSIDELGYAGEVVNQMTKGLVERDRIRQSLSLAKEVQQSLLPRKAPKIPGLDIAGKGIYCDETGGDYFDFLVSERNGKKKLITMVGDISGHGIPSALLMATARASLRQRVVLRGTASDIINDVNMQLSKDVEDTGRFMTLFYLDLDPAKNYFTWVRAGHDPAILYDPLTDSFTKLNGKGIALGLDKKWKYQSYSKEGIQPGQIIFIGTDGIWEARNRQDQLFGMEKIYRIIRKEALSNAIDIQKAILDELDKFQKGTIIEDDITIVILKFK